MKWRWLAIYAAIVAALFAVLVVVWLFLSDRGSKEPSWHGKTLSEWMFGHVTTNHGEFFDAEGVEAIKAIGTNGLPTLMRMLKSKDSELKSLIVIASNGQVDVLKRLYASEAILILGTNAFPVLPDLVKLTRNEDKEVRHESLFCLYRLRPDKSVIMPVLSERLQDSDPDIQEVAAGMLARRYPEDAERVGVFTKFAKIKRSGTNTVPTNAPPSE